jgi:hypothetical protein
MKGWRKVIVFTEALASFTFLTFALRLTEAAAFLGLGTAIGMLLGAAIYGNVQEWKIQNGNSKG